MSLDINLALDINLPIVTVSAHLQEEKKPLLILLSECHDEVLKCLNQYGAVLFRGFACHDEEYFSQAIELCALGTRCSTADYDLPRTVLPNKIYTSSELPAHIPLPLHHEKPRSIKPPNHIYFCCVTPALKEGGTVLANAESIWDDMPKKIQDKIMKHGVVYNQFFHGKSIKYYMLQKILGESHACSWSDYFGTEDKKQIEAQLVKNKATWNWVNKDCDLIVSAYLPGVLKHPITHKLSWFNSAAYLNYYVNFLYGKLHQLSFFKYWATRYMITKDEFPIICHYGNGQAFSADEIKTINKIIEHHSWVLNWQKGDFIILDNFTFMHGKQPHEGYRLLYSCMTQASE